MEATCRSHAVAPWLPKAPWRGLRIARIRRHLIAHGIEMVLLSHIVPQTKTLRRMCSGGWRSIVSGTQNKTSPLSTDRVSSAAVLLQKSIPIIIPCFNTVTYVRLMVEQLRNLGLTNIILIDNASSYPPMVSYLSEISSHVQVVWQKENKGPRDIFSDPRNRSLLPQFFCVTDPDLLFNTKLPSDFLAQLAALTEREKVGKAGFTIDISEPHLLREDDFYVVDRHWKFGNGKNNSGKINYRPHQAVIPFTKPISIRPLRFTISSILIRRSTLRQFGLPGISHANTCLGTEKTTCLPKKSSFTRKSPFIAII